jgi:hypothetical protein
MGTTIFDEPGVNARRIAAGTSHGFDKAQPAIVIATAHRAGNSDYVVLKMPEAIAIAKAILALQAEE